MLGRGVGQVAAEAAARLLALVGSGYAEVDQLGFFRRAFRQDDVGGRNIAVHDAARMHHRQALQDTVLEHGPFVIRQRTAQQQTLQRRPLHQFHDQKRAILIAQQIVAVDDGVMVDFEKGLGLLHKHGFGGLPDARIGADHFDGAQAAQAAVAGLIDGAHAARADGSQNLVLAEKYRAGLQGLRSRIGSG